MPLHQARLIVPRVCVAEVVRFLPTEPVDGAPGWLRGSLRWNDREIPLICFEELAGLPTIDARRPNAGCRVQRPDRELPAGAYGILTEGFPQLVRVNRDVMEPDTRHAWPESGPVICQIRMINEYPLIPDLERLEALIRDQLAAGERPA